MLHVCSGLIKPFWKIILTKEPNVTVSPKTMGFPLPCVFDLVHTPFALVVSVTLTAVVQLCLLLSYKCESFRASGKCRHVLFTLAD